MIKRYASVSFRHFNNAVNCADHHTQGNKFCVGDKVYLSEGRVLQGPFLIASVPSPGKYTLSKADGIKVQDGKVYEEKKLEAAD